MHALISIHDVAPETLDRVQALIDCLPQVCRPNLTLLVIPGKPWRPAEIARLRHWQGQGYTLAGHGWHHQIERIGNLYHQMHAWLISRNAAEHLCLSRAEIIALLQRNHAWFASQGLSSPDLYVPPAWAMGNVRRSDLAASPYRYFESGGGYFDANELKTVWLPLAGFEADTRFRSNALMAWNRLNALLGSDRHPLRIGLHPYDLELLLHEAVPGYLGKVTIARHYRDVFD